MTIATHLVLHSSPILRNESFFDSDAIVLFTLYLGNYDGA